MITRLSQRRLLPGLARCLPVSALACTLLSAPTLRAQSPSPKPGLTLAPVESNQSRRQEVQHAIDTGLAWLKTQQNPGGWWSNGDYPALTALVMTASFGDPARQGAALAAEGARDEGLRRAHAYLASCVQPDGGIYRKGLSNYNTAISLVALLAERRPDNDLILRRARRFVLSAQHHGPEGDPADGGFSYDPGGNGADLSNTVYSLEALHLSEGLQGPGDAAKDADLDVKAAVGFLQRCQNLPASNHEPWANGDAANKGGFIYGPGNPKVAIPAPGAPMPPGLRSYGTMTYAGLLSYVYADLKPGDPRVQAAHDWLLANYTIDENPGMGKQGLFYYFALMSKALSAYGTSEMTLPDGRKVDWREDLATELLSLQTKEGYWQNESGRWWEKDPVLASAYSLIALEFIYRRL